MINYNQTEPEVTANNVPGFAPQVDDTTYVPEQESEYSFREVITSYASPPDEQRLPMKRIVFISLLIILMAIAMYEPSIAEMM